MTTRADELIGSLTLEEKCSLTSGLDMWTTKPIERVGIPPVRLTDGPNGARGPVFAGEGRLTSACVPCGAALGATWDPAIVEEVGRVVAEEALTKGSRILLAPTVNIHRSPLAGRNFECYSEDPLLSGKMAAAFIRGAQATGVACTVKHFVGNEAESERGTVSSEIDERTLREIYLKPFEIAVREGAVLAVMTAYNRLNGTWVPDHEVLRDVLRGEWGFDGIVMTDWGGVGSTSSSIRAGLDLEMPGPGLFLGKHLLAAAERGEVDKVEVDECVRRLLNVFDQIGALDESPAEARSVDEPAHRAVARRAAAAATVLLRNDGVLPLDPGKIRTIAVIGPNAVSPTLMGGGAANFKPHHRTSILDAIRARFPEASVRFEAGSDRGSAPPTLAVPMSVRLATHESAEPMDELTYPDAQILFPGGVPGTDRGPFYVRAEGRFQVVEPGTYTFSLIQSTPSVVAVDGDVIIDGVNDPPPPGRFPWASLPSVVDVELSAGEHELVVTTTGETLEGRDVLVTGFNVGFQAAVGDDSIERAAAVARESDVAVVVVGTDAGWETEAVDRKHMNLRGNQDELVARICQANTNTIIVLNTGAPVSLPWADQASALLQVWFAGQEIGDALVDVLVGDAEPGGRLPTTFPIKNEHSPAFGTFPGENGVLRYGEGVFVGYRWYTSRELPVRFPFGHGLSYTTFDIGLPSVAGDYRDLTVTIPVTNTGGRGGSEVVQLYVSPPRSERPRPNLELRAFAKVELDPGDTTEVCLTLDRRAFARWDPALPDHDRIRDQLQSRGSADVEPPGPARGGWVVDPGTYHLNIGRSSADIAHRIPMEVRSDA
jgi:beta-glucosidase